jgi:ribonuclease BN (tRNA processing enzyme)
LGSEVKLFFVGTGSAKTNLKRFHTSFIISTPRSNLLIDCGDGISRELIRHNININSIENILITHLHPDHFSGLASLLVQKKMKRRTSELNIFIHKYLQNFLEHYFEQLYLFEERFPFRYKVIPYDYGVDINLCDNFDMITAPNSHLEKYSNTLRKNLISFVSPSYLFKVGELKIYYSSDVGDNRDFYLINSTYDYSIIETTHIEINDIEEFIELTSAKSVFLIHIDEDREMVLRDILSKKITNVKVFIPNDGDEYFL